MAIRDEIRARDRERVLAMSPQQRLELALRLGDEDVASFAATHGLSQAEARTTLRRQRQKGRRPSRCFDR